MPLGYIQGKVFSDFTLINVVQNDLCLRTSTPADQTLARFVLDGRVQVDAFQLEDSVICSCGLSPVCRLQLSVSPCADSAIIVVVVSTLTTSMAATKGATRKNDLYELLT